MLKEIKVYHGEENNKLSTCYFVDENEVKQRIYRTFHNNGSLCVEIAFKNGRWNNVCKVFYPKTTIIEQFKNNEKHGVCLVITF